MKESKLEELTNEELLQEAKKMKTTSITNAVFIGFLIGIVIYSVVKNTVGFFTLIPLFIAYRLIKKSKYDKAELEDLLKKRNLK